MRTLRNSSQSPRRPWLARVAAAAMVAGAAGLTGLAPATAEAQYYYGDRPHYQRHWQPPGYYRPPPPHYYRPAPPMYYRPPPAYYRPPPPVYYRPPPPPGFSLYIR